MNAKEIFPSNFKYKDYRKLKKYIYIENFYKYFYLWKNLSEFFYL